MRAVAVSDAQRIVAVAAASRSGAGAAKAWQAWGEGAPAVGEDGALTWERADGLARELGAAAELSRATGAPLADVLDAIAGVERAREESERALEVALAGPRASSRILGVLPLVGIALAVIVETRTLKVLVQPIGLACLAGAIALNVAGVAWIRAMTRAAADAGRVT